MKETNSDAMKPESPQTLTEEQIVTTKSVGRRSFLSLSGALLMGAAAIATGGRAWSATTNTDDRPTDKPRDPDKRTDSDRRSDPDRRTSDADKRRDPDKRPDATQQFISRFHY